MSETWLVLDGNYLCHRAMHTTGGLAHEDVATGVIFGFLRDINTLQDQHATDRMVFCFDHGIGLRKSVCSTYKQKRHADKPLTDLEIHRLAEFRAQVTGLRRYFLRQVGYRNVFYQKGYEADDIIASVVLSIPKRDTVIIVSADKDLYQLITDRIMIWNPTTKKMMTLQRFHTEFGIEPIQYVDVKAMAGCPTDEVKGIKGIGEKTAIKYLTGKLKSDSDAFDKIIKGNKIWRANRKLVKLPFPGTNRFMLRPDNVKPKDWQRLTESLGMNSLIDRAPRKKKKKHNGGFGL